MRDKARGKREKILREAGAVFARKGFKSVTMQEIVDACGISRGGVYLYFADIRELFLAVLAQERPPEYSIVMERVLSGDATVTEMLRAFLADQLEEALDTGRDLRLAEAEYYSIYADETTGPHPLRIRFTKTAEMIERLIMLGIQNGEFSCTDPGTAAEGILYRLEGIRSMNRVAGVERESAGAQLRRILQELDAGQSGFM
ncbi:MAG: TetR/AcrR family transcriptional regulator [Lachnospiraceae bacterium]|nr:TetR/AcrR family transcriptional regulator [Lachnospiraceae bacterium]